MGRQPRANGGRITAHVIAFGNSQPHVFADDHDRAFFLEEFDRVVAERLWTCHAYCLMDTHLHILVTSSSELLSGGMRDLLGRYSRAFNRRHGRRGHLFRDRHRAFVIGSAQHLRASVHGVLRVPVEAGIVDTAPSWRWSSCRAALGIDDPGTIVRVESELRLFGPTPAVARERLERLVASDTGAPITAGVAWAAERFNHAPPTIIAKTTKAIRDVVSALGETQGVKICLEQGYMRREIATALGVPESMITKRIKGTPYEELGLRRGSP